MKLRDIFTALAEGKKIRRPEWKKGLYIWLVQNEIVDNLGCPYPCIDVNHTWELYMD